MSVYMRIFALIIVQKRLAARLRPAPGPAGEFTALPQVPYLELGLRENWEGREWEGCAREGKRRQGKGRGRRKGGERWTKSHSFQIFWLYAHGVN